MISLKTQLYTALRHLGCNESMLNFDDASDIVISFTDIGDLRIVPEPSGDVSMWGLMRDMDVVSLRSCSYVLVEHVLAPAFYMANGVLSVRLCELGVQFGGVLTRESIDDATMLSGALVDFHARANALLEAIR